MDRLTELRDLYEKLLNYRKYLGRHIYKQNLNEKDKELTAELLSDLGRKVGYMGKLITELTGLANVDVYGKEYDMWVIALQIPAGELELSALGYCIQVTNRAIGQFEEDVKNGKRDAQGNLLTKEKIRSEKLDTKLESPIDLFDAMQFHPKVVEASKSCFTTVNYREAILNAFISLIDYIKELSGLDLDGDDLMNNVFSFNYDKEQRKITKYPTICINELKNKTDRDEQIGFKYLCRGAAAFVRNPKAHKLIAQTDPLHTLEYLAFASMLFKQLDKRIQIHHKEHSS